MAKRFIQYFEDSFKENWELVAMMNYVTKQSITYAQLASKIARLHIVFNELNLEKDDKVAIIGPNSQEWAISFMAVVTYGAIAVPILEDFTSEDITHIINHSDSKIIFTTESNWCRLEKAQVPYIQNVFSLSDFDNYHLFYGMDDQLLNDRVDFVLKEKYPHGFRKEDVVYSNKDNNEMIVLNYTSGTTGFTKGVMLSGENFCCILDFSRTSNLGDKGDKVISVLPLAHTYGCVYDFFLPLIVGAYIVYLNKVPSPKVIMQAMAEMKPEWISTVPIFFEAIYKKAFLKYLKKTYIKILLKVPLISSVLCNYFRNSLLNALGGNLKLLIVGGAALNPEIEDFYHKIKFPFTIGYGMTECSPLISVDYVKLKPHSVGRVIDDVQVKIDSKDSVKEAGEILVKGRNVMLGYYKDIEATSNAFTKDGWFKTGDIGVFDVDGNLFLKGRTKNMILTASGQNVYPEELEEKFNSYPSVSESLIIERKSKLIALVYPDYSYLGENVSFEDLSQGFESLRLDINKKLASYEYIHTIEIQSQPFEKTPKRSIKRFMYQ